jgi:hypothetical protein
LFNRGEEIDFNAGEGNGGGRRGGGEILIKICLIQKSGRGEILIKYMFSS